MKKLSVVILAYFLFIFPSTFLVSTSPFPYSLQITQTAEEDNLDDLSLEEILNLEVKPAPKENKWEVIVLITLRIFGENLKFPFEKKVIRIGTDIEKFHIKIWPADYRLFKRPIEDIMFYPGEKIDFDNFDIVFLKNKKLAKKFAATGKTLVFSNKKSCRHAAFIITVSQNRLKIRYRRKNIKLQGAEFKQQFLDSIDYKKIRKKN